MPASVSHKIDAFQNLFGKATDVEIAEAAGVGKATVTRYRKRRGIPPSGLPKKTNLGPFLVEGKTYRNASELARAYLVRVPTLLGRLKDGLTVEQAVGLERLPPTRETKDERCAREKREAETGLRECTACRKEKPLSDFYRQRKRNYRLRWCWTCERTRKYKSKFGDLTWENVMTLLESQGSKCAICGVPEPSKKWHLDHCHSTEVVRGVLCETCNLGLGAFRDSLELLRAAISYLQDPPAAGRM